MSNLALARIAYRFARDEFQKLERRAFDLRKEAESLEKIGSELATLKAGFRSAVCIACDGEGKIRVFQAQDESTVEACKACKGTGINPNA